MENKEQIIEYGSILELNYLVELDIEKEIKNIRMEIKDFNSHIPLEKLEEIEKEIENIKEKIKKTKKEENQIREIIVTYMEGGLEDDFLDEKEITKTVIDKISEIVYIEGIDIQTGKEIILNGINHEDITYIKAPKKKMKKEEIEEYRKELKKEKEKQKIYFIENETKIAEGIYISLTNKGFVTIKTNPTKGETNGDINSRVKKILNTLKIETVEINKIGDFQGKIKKTESELKKFKTQFEEEYKKEIRKKSQSYMNNKIKMNKP